MMRVLVCGGRDFSDAAMIDRTLSRMNIGVLIHGDARGADRLSGKWAVEHGVTVLAYPADWEKHGKRAGPIRNALMLRLGQPEVVVAFPGGKGTRNMIEQARGAGIDTIEIIAGTP